MRSIIIQARNGSSRLPNKMQMKIQNEYTIFEFLLSRLLEIIPKTNIILATTFNEKDYSLIESAKKFGIKTFQGNEENVLKRFIKCAEEYNISEIIRICADNPFLDLTDLQTLFDFKSLNEIDYVSFKIDGVPSIKTHYGFWGELITLNALQKVAMLTSEPIYLEHVTNYIYLNEDIFNIKFLQTSISDKILNNSIRLTLDNKNDLYHLRYILNILNDTNQEINTVNIYEVIKKNDRLFNLMQKEINKYIK